MNFRFGVLFSVAITVVAFWYVTPCNILLNSGIAEESASLQPWWWKQHIATNSHESARLHCVIFSIALSPGHSDITRFRPWSPIATGNNFDLAEKIPKVAQTIGTVDVFDPRSGISGPISRRASSCPHLLNDGPNPFTWDAQLLSYWFGRNPAVF